VPELHVLRVFVNEEGEWGNPLGVFLDGAAVPPTERQRIAAQLGFSETVFVEDRERGTLRIHTPAVELPFAGHPVVGAAWLLAREGTGVDVLRPPAGEVGVRTEAAGAFATAAPQWSPPFAYVQLDSPAEVRALHGPPSAGGNAYAWAWIDAAAGAVRARAFVPEADIAEDEATGSAALALCARLERPISVHQGNGSVILCRPTGRGTVEIGGNVTLDVVRDLPL
jgi:predicted PhzF superfamily epimerase YddE/YHI9